MYTTNNRGIKIFKCLSTPLEVNGKVLGYFDFPYYGKTKIFQEDISHFLVALVNVYVMFLLVAALWQSFYRVPLPTHSHLLLIILKKFN